MNSITKNRVLKGSSLSLSTALKAEQSATPLDRRASALEHKHLEGERISRILRFSSSSRIVQAQADRIFACSQRDNFYLAEDLHSTDTGELFAGKGSLWTCNSRICPNCVGKLAKRNRMISRHILENEKVLLGERWFLLTFTQPDLSLAGLPLLVCRSVMNEAWRKFSRSSWFEKVIRGGMKSEEFTVGNFDQYHYHIHSLAVCKNRITASNFIEIRREWTKALKFSFKRHNLEFECNTADGLANVRVDRTYSKEKVISELCKYITKADSWSKIPPEQLAEIATVERFPRMFEVFGACKQTAKLFLLSKREKTATEPANADSEQVNNHELASKDAYLDKKKITVRNSGTDFESIHAPPKKRASWRVRCRILSREQWLESLKKEIEDCQHYRMEQLRHKYAFASFQTLDGHQF